MCAFKPFCAVRNLYRWMRLAANPFQFTVLNVVWLGSCLQCLLNAYRIFFCCIIGDRELQMMVMAGDQWKVYRVKYLAPDKS